MIRVNQAASLLGERVANLRNAAAYQAGEADDVADETTHRAAGMRQIASAISKLVTLHIQEHTADIEAFFAGALLHHPEGEAPEAAAARAFAQLAAKLALDLRDDIERVATKTDMAAAAARGRAHALRQQRDALAAILVVPDGPDASPEPQA